MRVSLPVGLNSVRINNNDAQKPLHFTGTKESIKPDRFEFVSLKKRADIPALPPADVVIAVPHPDDETLFFGIIPKLVEEGKSVQLVYTTMGEGGFDRRELTDLEHDKSIFEQFGDRPAKQVRPPVAGLADVRAEEIREMAKSLGITRAPLVLDYPDGKCNDNVESIRADIQAVMKAVNPKEIFTFGPEGITPHPDHITVGNIVTDEVISHNKGKEDDEKISVNQVFFDKKQKSSLVEKTKDLKLIWNQYWQNVVPATIHKVDISTSQVDKLKEAMSAYASQFGHNGYVAPFHAFIGDCPYVNYIERK